MKHAWLLVLAAALLWFGLHGTDTAPDPVPDPAPAPIVDFKDPLPGEGLRVLILEEATDGRRNLPYQQLAILSSTLIDDWCEAHGAAIRIWDVNIDNAQDEEPWSEIPVKRTPDGLTEVDLPHDSLPWIVVTNGKAAFSGPLPATVDETIALLGKYAP